MSDKPISDLRRRMIEDVTIRTFSDKTDRLSPTNSWDAGRGRLQSGRHHGAGRARNLMFPFGRSATNC
jgi:hypothetical protein